MMTTQALERAARAAYEAWIDDVRDLEPAWNDLPESHRYRLVQSARAVLMAVRDDQDDVITDLVRANRGEFYAPEYLPYDFTAVIDVILGEGEGE